MELDISPCTFFISLYEDKFIPLINENDIVDIDKLIQYMVKGITTLYFEKENCSKWESYLADKIKDSLVEQEFTHYRPRTSRVMRSPHYVC